MVRARAFGVACALSVACAAPVAADTANTLGDADLAAPLHRAEIVRAALARNPGYRAAAQRARATETLARSEGTLPPPEAMAQVWQVPIGRPYAIGDAQMIMFGVTQSFPAPGALSAREKAKAQDARVEGAMADDRARMIARDAEHAFVDYAEVLARHHIHVEHAKIAERVLAIAHARQEAGGPLTDITQAEVELARVRADVSTDQARTVAARARLNALLARAPDAALGEPVLDPPTVPGMNAVAITKRAADARPELRAARAAREARALDLDAASAEAKWPSFSLSALYFAPTSGLPSSGYGASFTMSLPWLWGAAERRADAQRGYASAARDEVTAAQIAVDAEVASAEAVARAAAVRLLVERDSALPASQRSYDAAWSGYSAGRTDILTLINARRAVIDIELDVVMARSALDHALADLDAAAGFAVPRAPLASQPTSAAGESDVHR